MARPIQRRKTERQQVEDRTRPAGLESNRRFFVAGGHDKNVRAARALEEAFNVGSRFVADEQFRRNAAGRQLAVTERGSGASAPDPDNKQAGYMRAWEELDAEFDYNLAEKALPELLRGADWEDKPEAEVQQLISKYMASQFDGVQDMQESPYAQTLAPRLLALENKLISEHRDMQIAKVHEEQRTKTYANAEAQLLRDREAWAQARARKEDVGEDPPGLDYTTLFARTGKFFDGPMKKTIFWETVYDLAIKTGDSSIITNMPETINNVATGIKDPSLQDQHRAAIASAEGVAAKRLEAAETARKEADEQDVFDTMLLIADKSMRGENVSAEIGRLRNNPEASFSDVSAAMNFGQGQRTEHEKRSPNLPLVATLWSDIYDGEAQLGDIFTAHEQGLLGSGPQALATMQQMMSTTRQVRESAKREDSSSVGTYRTGLKDHYNPSRAGMFAELNPEMLHIRTLAMDEYNLLVLEQDVPPAQAARQIREKYDPMVDELVGEADSTSKFTQERLLTPSVVKEIAAGDRPVDTLPRGMTKYALEGSLIKLLDSGDITQAEAEAFISAIN